MVAGEIACKKVYEDDLTLAFHDAKPQAPTHILVIPKEHLESLNDAGQSDEALLGHLLRVVSKIANKLEVAESGFRAVINTGENSGQSVFHLHVHLLGGRSLAWPPG
jgi:histidine triad (HIT) family protein